MNSQNRSKAGQNVLYNDGHVLWCNNPFVGVDHDNIYTRWGGSSGKAGFSHHKYDTLLLPTFAVIHPHR